MRKVLIVLFIIGSLLCSQISYAKRSKPDVISKGEAISAVKSELRGKILSIHLIPSEGPPVYKVKLLLAKGRVRTVFVDGQSGQIIRIR